MALPLFLLGCAAVLALAGGFAYWTRMQRTPPLIAAPLRTSSRHRSAPKQRILLLGPEAAGKSTLLWQAVRLYESPAAADACAPRRPTGGLVRRRMCVPTASGELATVQLCEGGGAPSVRRQWVTLVNDGSTRVVTLVFVADIRDSSDDTRALFAQLANAPWSRDALVLLVLTKTDLLGEDSLLDQPAGTAAGSAGSAALVDRLCTERIEQYAAACRGRPFACEALSSHDELAARQMLRRAMADATPDDD